MKIEALYFEGCPNYLPAVDRLASGKGLAETRIF
jgi:hypothetical protein